MISNCICIAVCGSCFNDRAILLFSDIIAPGEWWYVVVVMMMMMMMPINHVCVCGQATRHRRHRHHARSSPALQTCSYLTISRQDGPSQNRSHRPRHRYLARRESEDLLGQRDRRYNHYCHHHHQHHYVGLQLQCAVKPSGVQWQSHGRSGV